MTSDTLHYVTVEDGYASWRRYALQALAAGWPPESVLWTDGSVSTVGTSEQLGLVYAASSSPEGSVKACAVDVRVSKALSGLLNDAALFRSADRWSRLYRVLWRWWKGDREVASAADEDGARLHLMAKAVRRAKHDFIAYVRFQHCGVSDGPEYLAWYEPNHDVLEWGAEHFAQRMGSTTWCIATPHGAALWDGCELRFTQARLDVDAIRATMAADQIEPLWKIYYQSIFNPARLNEAALYQNMPVRFWKNLPEGPLIPEMIARARSGACRVGQAETVSQRPGRKIANRTHGIT